ncbi:MAG: putative addiction module antidote protein [Cellvibrionaceae bacterium]|nr:putative addiction module antidote protein [Cellvibrionaceae bacterium]
MVNKQHYRTLDQVDEAYYRNHPEEIGDYLALAFEDYAQDGCTAALLSQLRMIARVKGISAIAGETGISRNGIQKALSERGNPKFASINAIMHAMGYQLVPQQLSVRCSPPVQGCGHA